MKYKKELSIIVAVMICVVGKQIKLSEIKNSMEQKTINIEQNDVAQKVPMKKVGINKIIKWQEQRKIVRENGGVLYQIEDLTPELIKPKDWDGFFLLKNIPEGFYLEDIQVEEHEGIIVTYCFKNVYYQEKEFYFIQTDANNRKNRVFQNIKKMEKNKYYYGKEQDFYIVSWIEDEITISMKTNMSIKVLEDVVEYVISYNDVELNYNNM